MKIIKKRNRAGVLCYMREDAAAIRGSNHEQGEQKTVWGWIEHNHPSMAALTWHTANERRATAFHMAQNASMGVQSGVADLVTFWSGAKHAAGAFELKRESTKEGRLSPEQRRFLLAAEQQGKFACCAYGALACQVAIIEYLTGEFISGLTTEKALYVMRECAKV